MTPLCGLALWHGTDKFAKHNYTPVYHDLLSGRREGVRRVLEIGVKTGASLRMWEQFFPNAMIFGIDRKSRWQFKSGRIRTFVADQDDVPSMLNAVRAIGGNLDLIVDDGSHVPRHQVTSMIALLPYLSPGGIYVIEDVDDDSIVGSVPKRHRFDKIRTSDAHSDSVLVVVTGC